MVVRNDKKYRHADIILRNHMICNMIWVKNGKYSAANKKKKGDDAA